MHFDESKTQKVPTFVSNQLEMCLKLNQNKRDVHRVFGRKRSLNLWIFEGYFFEQLLDQSRAFRKCAFFLQVGK